MSIFDKPFSETLHFTGGTHRNYIFPNGYGASVIPDGTSIGREFPLYELAVLHLDGKGHDLCYRTPITEDVLRYRTQYEIENALAAIAALPACDDCLHHRDWTVSTVETEGEQA